MEVGEDEGCGFLSLLLRHTEKRALVKRRLLFFTLYWVCSRVLLCLNVTLGRRWLCLLVQPADLIDVSVFIVAVGFAGLIQLSLQLISVCILHSFNCCEKK